MFDKHRTKVSVVIPTYGRAKMVKQAVMSALFQELEPYEVIVSDDVSPDNTIEVLSEVAAKFSNFILLKNESNSGGVANWNKVIDAASGDFIAYCSDDDYFLPFHLKSAVEYLESHPDVDMVHSGFFNLSESGREFPKITQELISADVKIIHGTTTLKHIVRQTSYPFQPSTLVFRKKLWLSVGHFDPKYSVADTDWFIRAGLSHKIAYLPIASVVNRRHQNNWSNRVGSVAMNLEFHNMMRDALEKSKCNKDVFGFSMLKIHWLITELVKFSRIYISRSRAGLFEVAHDCSDAIWDIIFMGGRGKLYKLYATFTNATSRALRIIQYILPGGVKKYKSLGQDCPK